MKNRVFWAALLAAGTLVSCKKDETSPAPTERFMSFTAGSTWNYRLTDNSASTSSLYTLTATGTDTVANGRTYKIFTNSSGPNQYYNLTGNNYYTFWRLPDALGGGSVEVLYLKDNLKVGETWSQSSPITVSGYPLVLTLNSKIAQKGISKTVNGITYNNVTDVETTLSVAGIPIPYTLTTDIHNYYAPKVGEIENKMKLNFSVTGLPPNSFDQKTELLSATVL